MACFLSAAENAVIVRSPYYGEQSYEYRAGSLERSYAAQLGLSEEAVPPLSTEERVLAAIANPSYPVTPGDMISLSYTDGKTVVSQALQVDGSYQLSVPGFGTVDGKGKTFTLFAREIENLVATYLPYSLPRVTLAGTGAFTVIVRGEVASTQEIAVWGLSRLSAVVQGATPYASTRSITISSADGTSRTYDLYAALREGDLTQDPLVRAGDIITIPPAHTIITVEGEVVRPGVYQPLEGESLAAILSRYGKGVLPSGDPEGVVVRRYGVGSKPAIDMIGIKAAQLPSFFLRHLDTVFVSPMIPLSRSVTIEGAVNMGNVEAQSDMLSSSGKLYYQFYPGETVLEMVQNISSRFSATSDLAAAYLLREDSLIPINIYAMLMGQPSESSSLTLQEGDRFIIPFNQLFVSVAGGVLKPGIYPYIPDKRASYYINIAGGFDPAKNRNGDFTVVDKKGTKLSKDAVVPPEAVVTAKLNTFQAVNGLNLTTTVTIVGLVAAIVSILVDVADLTGN